jgi:hypothetical protein
MLQRYRFALLAAFVLIAAASPALSQPTHGFTEQFPGTSLSGFTGGSPLNNPGTGGFLGVGDGFLRIANTANANFGANSSLSAAFSGDYDAAGIDEIRLHLNDVGGDQAFELHVGIGNTTNFWQYNTGFLPPNGSWGEFVVPLNGPAGWTRIGGVVGTFQEALQTADRILVRHDLAPYISTPNTISGDVGVDNIRLISYATPAASTSWGRIKKLYR